MPRRNKRSIAQSLKMLKWKVLREAKAASAEGPVSKSSKSVSAVIIVKPEQDSKGDDMDIELYMECDEEELQPWQLIDDGVDEDDTDLYGEPVEDSSSTLSCSEASPSMTPSRSPVHGAPSPLASVSSSLLPPPPPVSSSLRPPSSIVSFSLSQPIISPSLPPPPPPTSSSSLTLPIISPSLPPPPPPTSSSSLTLPIISSSLSLAPPPTSSSPLPPTITSSSSLPPPTSTVSSLLPQPILSASLHQSSIVPSSLSPHPLTVASSSALVKQAPPLILTQTAGGAFFLPAAAGGTGAGQPFLLTAQGFPVQVGPGGNLVLNLQTGQTMQPLTLIQSNSSLGQLVRPGVGVSPVQTRLAPSVGSAITTVQLPTSLTLRTSTPGPVQLQMTSVGGANALKLASCPALPSGSANGVTRVVTQNSGASLAVSPAFATRIVMSVEEFYYGTFEGDLNLRKPQHLGVETFSFTCHTCSHPAENNLRLMQHMLQHSELVGTDGGEASEEKKSCRFCYRLFSSPIQLQSHQEQVHSPGTSSCMCRICEWAFQNEPSYLNHMKTYHKPGEMPYVCQVCLYRSSFYSNVLQHFASFHRDSRFLLCVFCFRVTRNPTSYQQHLLRHKKSQAFHCNRCRLQFVLLKEKMQHKLNHHRSFRRPPRLEGLPPGSKVTIRTYSKIRQPPLPNPASVIRPINIRTEVMKSPLKNTPLASKSQRASADNLIRSRVHMHRSSMMAGRLVCLECGSDASELSAHYPTHVRCLLCPYNSCCSRAYAAHMIHHHVPHRKDKILPLHKQPPPCVYLLRCSGCEFGTPTADLMADHLQLNPQHHSATCSPRGSQTVETPCVRPFLKYEQKKERERRIFSYGKKVAKKPNKVRINVGLMTIGRWGGVQPQRGKTLWLSTDPDVTAPDLLDQAVKKMKEFNKDLEDEPYVLLYPDGSEVVNVPGTEKPFTLQSYKTQIGRSYQRITIFICLKTDFEEVGELSDTSHSDYEIVTTEWRGEFERADSLTRYLNEEHNYPSTSTCLDVRRSAHRNYTDLFAPDVIDGDEGDVTTAENKDVPFEDSEFSRVKRTPSSNQRPVPSSNQRPVPSSIQRPVPSSNQRILLSPEVHLEPDIQFCCTDEHQSEGEQKESHQSWRSANVWVEPSNLVRPEVVPFSQPTGPHHSLSKNTDTIDFFNLLFPMKLMQLIASETNAHAKTCRYLGSGPLAWVPVTTDEIKCFIGLVVLMGVQNLPKPVQYWSWNHYDNSYTFNRAMSYKRFSQIAANIRMGSFTTEEHRRSHQPNDPLHIFRPMLDILGAAMWSTYRPNCCLTIDRALLPSLEEEGQARADPMTQPQVWLLCDSKSGYCHRLSVQVGEKPGQDPGFIVVPELVVGLEQKHHQLYLASSLTSVPLMQKLLDQGIYASSSFPPPSPILPRELWEEGRLEKPGNFLQKQFGPLLATRWKDTKEMGCLSTNAPPGEVDTVWRRSQTKVGALDPIDRPMAFCLLQENMRGVDICKQLLACNPLGGIPQDRHWRSLFWFLVNLSIVNAFILLRESRKENPPSWVQDGLFTQVNFRKHLGNQLAKCTQKYSSTVNVASTRGPTEENEPKRLRHRLAKLSNLSKRCRICNLRNLRRESRYGCFACKAPLCKNPRCFWEFHGLSPENKGSTKIGFLKDQISGEVVVEKEGEAVEEDVEEDMDQEMAPVEDLDFSDDEGLAELKEDMEETEALKEDISEDEKLPVSDIQSAASSSVSKEREHPLNARQLRIALFTLCDGIRPACRVFFTDPELVRSWLKEARRHLERSEEAEPDGVGRMASWVLSMREQQLPITETNLFHKASTLKKKGFFSPAFRISYQWAVDFLLLHRLGVRTSGFTPSLARVLPPPLQSKVASFREFTQKVARLHQLARGSVAAMDELCLFMDWRLTDDPSQCCEALQLTGSTPVVTVYLSASADGVMLPALVVVTQQLAEKQLPACVVVQVCAVWPVAERVLEVWTKRVWLPHLSGPTQPRKSMLILNRHREHLGDSFLSTVSSSGTLPAIIPAGCSFHLQPLHLCVKPLLQRLLLTRWAQFCATGMKKLENIPLQVLQNQIVQLLVDWVVEALTFLNDAPHVWKKSFDLTGLMQRAEEEEEEEEEEEKRKQRPEEVQRDLLKSLIESLLGSEASDPTAQLDLEYEDDAEEQHEEQHEDRQVEVRREDLLEVRREDRQGEDREETEDKERGAETMNLEGKETENIEKIEEKEGQETVELEGKMTEDMKKGEKTNDEIEESRKTEEDSEEETKEEEEEDRRDLNKERRETRIVIGEEVGDEWKMTVKSRAEGESKD